MNTTDKVKVSVCFVFIIIATILSGKAYGNLVAEYNFDESSGTIAHTSVGSVDGTLLGAATFVPGAGLNGSGAISLNRGTGDLVSMGNNFGFSTFSIQAWVKIPDGYTSVEVPFGKHVAGAGVGYYVSVSEYVLGEAHFYPGNFPFTPDTNVTINDGIWHQIVATLDSNTGIASLYIDGALNTFVAGASTQFNTTDFLIGGTTYGPTYTGLIDDVQIYNNVLSADAVQSLYSNIEGGNVPTATPEPGTMLLMGVGAAGAAFLNRRKANI